VPSHTYGQDRSQDPATKPSSLRDFLAAPRNYCSIGIGDHCCGGGSSLCNQLSLTLHWHNAAAASTGADDHIEVLIDKRLDPINQRLSQLTEQVNDALGQLKRIDVEVRLSRLGNPSKILANIRTTLQLAADTYY
jgi:hypothetical protein